MFGNSPAQNTCCVNPIEGMATAQNAPHIETAIGFANHILESFSIDDQTAMLFAIQKRIIEHRRRTLEDLDMQIKRAQDDREKTLHALNIIC